MMRIMWLCHYYWVSYITMKILRHCTHFSNWCIPPRSLECMENEREKNKSTVSIWFRHCENILESMRSTVWNRLTSNWKLRRPWTFTGTEALYSYAITRQNCIAKQFNRFFFFLLLANAKVMQCAYFSVWVIPNSSARVRCWGCFMNGKAIYPL